MSNGKRWRFWMLLGGALMLAYASYELLGGSLLDYYRDVQEMSEPGSDTVPFDGSDR